MSGGARALAEALGWIATLVFVSSYFSRRAEVLARVQMAGAALWIAYGLAMRAPPVVVANLLVLAAAAWKALRPRRAAARVPAAARAPGGRAPRWRPLARRQRS